MVTLRDCLNLFESHYEICIYDINHEPFLTYIELRKLQELIKDKTDKDLQELLKINVKSIEVSHTGGHGEPSIAVLKITLECIQKRY